MTRIEIHTYLAKKVEAAWTAYEEAMLQRPARSIFAKAAEIDAARTCFEELVLNAKAYPDDLLEYLLRYLKEEGDYRNVEKTAARAARLSPNEGWEIWQTDSLIALGRHKEAGKVYQQIAEHTQEMGGFLSQKQQAQLREVGSRIHQPEGTEKDIGRCLMESGVPEGAYACTLLGFLDCFRMLKRALARGVLRALPCSCAPYWMQAAALQRRGNTASGRAKNCADPFGAACAGATSIPGTAMTSTCCCA